MNGGDGGAALPVVAQRTSWTRFIAEDTTRMHKRGRDSVNVRSTGSTSAELSLSYSSRVREEVTI